MDVNSYSYTGDGFLTDSPAEKRGPIYDHATIDKRVFSGGTIYVVVFNDGSWNKFNGLRKALNFARSLARVVKSSTAIGERLRG